MNLLRTLCVAALVLAATVITSRSAGAQARERPVTFDSAGRVSVITPPLAARLNLAPPVFPASGDYTEARLYALDDATGSYVLVLRRQRDVLERYPLTAAQRSELAAAIARGNAAARLRAGPDSAPTFVSEPVRGSFVTSQTLLAGFLFGPAAAAMISEPAASTAAYLFVTGGTFFLAANLTKTSSVSRAQNHLASHSAVRGAIAASLGLYALAGDGLDEKVHAAAILGGGILGDVVGFQLAKPMTDAEAHGTSQGSTVTAALTAGLLGTAGLYKDNGSGRLAAAAIIGAGALGYPLGLRYVRTASYNITAGDVGALYTAELLGLAAAATFIPDQSPSSEQVAGLLTAGFATGLLVGDRALVRPFDHTDSDARLLYVGTGAGALVGVAIPVLAQSNNPHFYFGAATVGGLLGAILTENMIAPQRAGDDRRTGSLKQTDGRRSNSRVAMRFALEAALMTAFKQPGYHSIFSMTF